jgi:glycosyltransferase involved in cell wall biosynthesis
VKNEKNTRGGGVESFVNAIVPHVGRAIIVDTGSEDGTLEKLRKMQNEYKNLEIYQRPFDDFASSRNYSLSKANYGKVLVLDADERTSNENLLTLQEEIEEAKSIGSFDGFLFSVENILKNGERRMYSAPLNPRLFEFEKGVYFENAIKYHSEQLIFNGLRFCDKPVFQTSVVIDHFYTPKDYR